MTATTVRPTATISAAIALTQTARDCGEPPSNPIAAHLQRLLALQVTLTGDHGEAR